MKRFFLGFGVAVVFSLLGTLASAGPHEVVTGLEVRGTVGFEPRYTVVPAWNCVNADCPKSTSYWTIVVQSGLMKYEILLPFSVGKYHPPESVVVAGVVLRPGSRVTIEGTLEIISRHYAVIRDVERVGFVMDLPAADSESGEENR